MTWGMCAVSSEYSSPADGSQGPPRTIESTSFMTQGIGSHFRPRGKEHHGFPFDYIHVDSHGKACYESGDVHFFPFFFPFSVD